MARNRLPSPTARRIDPRRLPEFAGPWQNQGDLRRQQVLEKFVERMMTVNANSSRFLWERGNSGSDPDPRRDVDEECGWPKYPTPENYGRLWNFDSIAPRVVGFMPRECWSSPPTIYEKEKGSVTTPFEKFFYNDLVSMFRGEFNWLENQEGKGGHPLWVLLAKADVLSRVGQYGIVWWGFDDGLDPWLPVAGLEEFGSKPVKFEKGKKEPEKLYSENGKVNNHWRLTVNREVVGGKANDLFDRAKPLAKDRRLLFATPYQESQCRVTRWESNRNSPRYRQPLEYEITTIDPNGGYYGHGFPVSTERIHWTRATHYADTHHHPTSNDYLAVPAMQATLYDILDGRKITGFGAEAFVRNVMMKIFFETHAQLGGDVLVDDEELREMMERMDTGSQQHGRLSGMSANPVAPTVVDPNPHLDAKYKRMSINIGTPKRVFEGSERGELSSSQDDSDHKGRISERNDNYTIYSVIGRSVNWLILTGVQPEPESGKFFVDMPPPGSEDEKLAAEIFSIRMTAFGTYVEKGVEALIPPREMLTAEAGLSDKEADAWLKAAEEHQLEMEQEAQDVADEIGAEPIAPDGFEKPQPEEPPGPVKVKPGEKVVFPKPKGF